MGAVHAREASPSAPSLPSSSSQPPTVPLDSIGAQVVRVHFDGVGRTKEDLLVANARPIFEVAHFEDLVLKSQVVRNNLRDLGCFSEVDVHIDTSASTGGAADYEVTFKVKELKRVVGSVNTMVGNQEGSLLTGVRMPNVAGRGERVHLDYSYSTKRTSGLDLGVVKPIHGRAKTNVAASVFQQMAEFPTSGFKEMDRGVRFDVSFLSAPQISHNLQWEGVWRNLSSYSRSSAFAVRRQSGHTLKSAVRHILTVDRRDEPVFPSEGSLLRLVQEYAGLGGDVGFFKSEAQLQANLPLLLPDLVLQGTFNCGYIRQHPDPEMALTISDKFFIGGPLNVRGFDMRGIGSESDGNYLGGNVYWTSGLHLFAPLPFRPGAGGFGDLFRTHVFVNAGNLGDFFRLSGDSERGLDEALRDMRLSYGVGLAMKLGGIARIELNYCIPVKSQRGDKPSPGLQFGVGVNFL